MVIYSCRVYYVGWDCLILLYVCSPISFQCSWYGNSQRSLFLLIIQFKYKAIRSKEGWECPITFPLRFLNVIWLASSNLLCKCLLGNQRSWSDHWKHNEFCWGLVPKIIKICLLLVAWKLQSTSVRRRALCVNNHPCFCTFPQKPLVRFWFNLITMITQGWESDYIFLKGGWPLPRGWWVRPNGIKYC